MAYFDRDHPTFLAEPVSAADHARGPADPNSATVTLVEFGDFACPSCGESYGIIKALLARRPDLRFVFRANPRSHLFPHAEIAAEAAEAAAAQGKFWEMHDLLFENQATLSRAEISRLAGTLGLDLARFDRELDTGAHRGTVRAQEVSGWHSHVLSTPTFFINGVRFEDASSALPAAIDGAARQDRLEHQLFREVRVAGTVGSMGGDTVGRTADRHLQTISIGPHRLVSDLPSLEGGADAGPSPHDLLAAALGSCTAMTVAWSAAKHKIPLQGIDVRVTQSRGSAGHLFRVAIELRGDLDDAQRATLERAAGYCPVARTLQHPIAIDTRVTAAGIVDEAGEETFPASDAPAWTLGRDRPPK
jgi:uncharacterized OsmC-like protein/predicted DsbA family dithiol-disulfide isomerase